MSKISIIFLLLSSYCFSSQYDYTLNITINDENVTSKVYMNDELVTCYCGQQPVFIMSLYGKFEYYCINHMPEIEYCRRITTKDVDELLKSIHDVSWTCDYE